MMVVPTFHERPLVQYISKRGREGGKHDTEAPNDTPLV